MMTEKEALTKWCPFTRLHPLLVPSQKIMTGSVEMGIQPVTNRHPELPQQVCLAGGCAAWRWRDNETGYCGMAGKP